MSCTLRKALSPIGWAIIPPMSFDGFPAHIYKEIEKGKNPDGNSLIYVIF